MAYKQKGYYGQYSGNAKHSRRHMVNSWEEEDVKRGKQQMKEGHKGHAEALFDDAHGSYNYDGKNSTGAERNDSPANFGIGMALGGLAGSIFGRKKGRGRRARHQEIITKLDSIESQLAGDNAGATTEGEDAAAAQETGGAAEAVNEFISGGAQGITNSIAGASRGTLPVSGDLTNPVEEG
jgi:hypothetical protein